MAGVIVSLLTLTLKPMQEDPSGSGAKKVRVEAGLGLILALRKGFVASVSASETPLPHPAAYLSCCRHQLHRNPLRGRIRFGVRVANPRFRV